MPWWILDDEKNPIPVEDVLEWATWFDSGNRTVRFDEVGEVRVSTVFLGLDHSFGGEVPILFETMIFGGVHDGYQGRYATWDEAVKGYIRALRLLEQ